MKVTVKDAEILKTIEPQQLKNYLQTRGWYEDRPFLENATIWYQKEAAKGGYEILFPLRQNLGDYAARISEAIQILEIVEKRSQLEILSDLITNLPEITISGFVTQIMAPNSDTLSGEVIVIGTILEKLRQIKIELADNEYILAIKAYQERLPVVFTGDLMKENNFFKMKNISHFKLENIKN